MVLRIVCTSRGLLIKRISSRIGSRLRIFTWGAAALICSLRAAARERRQSEASAAEAAVRLLV